MTTPRIPELTAIQRMRADDARALLAIEDIPSAHGLGPDNLAFAYGVAYGHAKGIIMGLLQVIDELTSGSPK